MNSMSLQLSHSHGANNHINNRQLDRTMIVIPVKKHIPLPPWIRWSKLHGRYVLQKPDELVCDECGGFGDDHDDDCSHYDDEA